VQQLTAGRSEQTVNCKAEASPGPTVYWLRKGMPIKNGECFSRNKTLEYIYIVNLDSVPDDKYTITNDGLSVKNIQIEDEGIYICQALVTATGQAKSFSIDVQVITPPKWIQQPMDTEGVRGQDVILRCDATAKPPPFVRFQRNGVDIVNGERYIVQDSMLTIRRLENSDGATYACIATNQAGELSAALKLTVLIGPVIRPFESQLVMENVQASFLCSVIEAFPPPTFRWKYADTQQFIDTVSIGC
jgi:hypothetical protein